MAEGESYIQAYLNSKSNSLSFYVLELLKPNLKEAKKQFLIEKILEFISDAELIIHKMGIVSIPVNTFCNYLMLLQDMHILKIDSFLKQYDYQKTLNQKYDSIKEKISNNEIPTGVDQKTMEFLITNHLIPNEDQKDIFEFYIKCILLKDQPISYDTFEILMIDYTKFLMQSFVDNPEVYIKSAEDLKNKYGYSYQNIMYLCKEELEQLYNLGLFRPLKTIFHELCHLAQYSEININNKTSKRISTMIKDEILSEYLSNYYEDNYELLLSEVEAEIYSIQTILSMFSKFGINFRNNQNPYANTVVKLKESINSDMRVIGNEMMPLGEIFDSFIIHHPKLLDTYPQLALEYRIESDDMVVKNNDFRRIS